MDALQTERERLILQLEKERQATLALLQSMSDTTLVDVTTGWRAQDYLAYQAAWEREILAALQAFQEGDQYTIVGYDESTYRQAQYQRRKDLNAMQVRMDWFMVRRDVQFALHDLPAERWSELMTYPTGERGSVITLIENLLAFEATQRAALAQATTSEGK